MRQIKDVQKAKDSYIVNFEDELIHIDFEIYLKYRLKVGMSFDERSYDKLIKDNAFQVYYKLAIKKLKRMLTVFEMKTYLLNQGISQDLMKQIINHLVEKRYLDDELYVKTYIQLKSNLYGPKMISFHLKEKGVPFHLIDEALKKMDETHAVDQLISKKLVSLRHKSIRQTKVNLKQYLLQKGFSIEVIDCAISKLTFDKDKDFSNLKRTYEKLVLKMNGPLDYTQKQHITQKLIQKGYQLEDIKKIMS